MSSGRLYLGCAENSSFRTPLVPVCEGTEIVSIAVGQKQYGSRSRSRRPGLRESRRHWNAPGAVAWMARLFCWNIKWGRNGSMQYLVSFWKRSGGVI